LALLLLLPLLPPPYALLQSYLARLHGFLQGFLCPLAVLLCNFLALKCHLKVGKGLLIPR
jgi:hypothetical protein